MRCVTHGFDWCGADTLVPLVQSGHILQTVTDMGLKVSIDLLCFK